jgi:anti-sigma factor RsiW
MTMIENNHILEQISDYVLNLLPEAEKQRLAHHVAGCGQCYQALLKERHMVRSMQSTIDAATKPDRDRLEHLRPAVPQRTARHHAFPIWQRQLAAIGVVILLLMGGVSLSAGQKAGSWFKLSPNDYRPATATLTDTPTMTATATLVSSLPAQATSAPQYFEPNLSPRPAVTPGPIPARPLPALRD